MAEEGDKQDQGEGDQFNRGWCEHQSPLDLIVFDETNGREEGEEEDEMMMAHRQGGDHACHGWIANCQLLTRFLREGNFPLFHSPNQIFPMPCPRVIFFFLITPSFPRLMGSIDNNKTRRRRRHSLRVLPPPLLHPIRNPNQLVRPPALQASSHQECSACTQHMDDERTDPAIGKQQVADWKLPIND